MELQVGVKVLDRLPVGRGVGSVNVSLHQGIRPCSADLKGDIGHPRDGIIKAGQRGGRRNVHVVQVHVRCVGTGLGELSLLQAGADIEIGARVPAPQRAAAKRKIMRRELNRGRQRIPMHLLLGGARG